MVLISCSMDKSEEKSPQHNKFNEDVKNYGNYANVMWKWLQEL